MRQGRTPSGRDAASTCVSGAVRCLGVASVLGRSIHDHVPSIAGPGQDGPARGTSQAASFVFVERSATGSERVRLFVRMRRDQYLFQDRSPPFRCYETTLVVAYARPFTQSRGGAAPLTMQMGDLKL